ncbi:hypothetical protein FOZ63_029656 [Perkinsus olseni]|uniref:Uncharacterized protein n=1 Tax=Perkinsus olseni TaxID=32597 RepID=A0A7J6PEF9_PEROL|nr:hypothetical protein FOZ63_029656 [Perkinsus olseni]
MQPAGSLKTQGLQGAAGTPGKAALRRFLRAKGHQPSRGVALVVSPQSHTDGKDALKHFLRAKGYQPSPKEAKISREGLVDVDLFEDLWAQLTRSPTEPSSGNLRPDALLDYLDPVHDDPI